ncbi:Satratoxin biosynthesis SC1 cluster protein 4 [Colletotrichum sp. SAR11_239]|nr:Satratoxin biosynthesis SC1 cluster protein 4 [Colletotrichum sp. SAR11_239]
MASSDPEYMADPPDGQGRFDAGTITTGALVLGGVLTSISVIFVGLRIFTRLSLVKRSLGADDYFIAVSLSLAIVFYGLSIEYTLYLVLAATNIIMDIVCLILPLKIIIPLQMPKRQKWSLIALFATGGFVCLCAIRRTVLLPPLFQSKDFTRDVEKQLNWASVEVNAGIICASVPALKPFFMRYLPMFVHSHITGSSKKSNANYQNYQTSMPYSTTVENNRKRRNVQSEAYELHSHDDLSLSSHEMPKAGSDEDVTKLWSGSAFRNDRTSQLLTTIESKTMDMDANSIDSAGEIMPAEGSSTGQGSQGPRRMASFHGITVTTELETKVDYEKT